MYQTSVLLEARVARLERVNKIMLVGILASLVVLLCAAVAPQHNVTARAIQLVDENGAVTAKLITRDGHPGLYLSDAQGVERVALFHAPDASGLHVMDAHGVTRIGAVQFAHGGGGLALHGPGSKGAAVLYFKRSGSLRFFDDEGSVTVDVSAPAPTDH